MRIEIDVQPETAALVNEAKTRGVSIDALLRETLKKAPNGAPASAAKSAALDALLDLDYINECAAEAGPSITLASVRQALSKIPGTMTADFRAERNERSL